MRKLKLLLIRIICFWVPVKEMRRRLRYELNAAWIGENVCCLTTPEAKGTVLLSYLKDPLLLSDGDERLEYHSNVWECREIARIFQSRGYNVEAIVWNDKHFKPKKKYDVIFDIADNIARFNNMLPENCLKMLHLTESFSCFQNQAEKRRVENFCHRRCCSYRPKRQKDEYLSQQSLALADYCTLIGNEVSKKTYPQKYQSKIHCIPVSAAYLPGLKRRGQYLPKEREFLWMGGAGAVHKGLDLLVDVFIRHPEWKLHIVGNLEQEPDFMAVYQHFFSECDNIVYHGFLHLAGDEFSSIAGKCFAFIFPSCSEGMSVAVMTLLRLGLYPVISRNSGVDLPAGCGKYLLSCSEEEIEQALADLFLKNDENLCREIEACQKLAVQISSRENFRRVMEKNIDTFLSLKG